MTKEERKAYNKSYREKNIDKIKQQSKEYSILNIEKIRLKEKNRNKDTVREREKRYVNEANDLYIKKRLKSQGFPKESITPELIELKRITLKTTRLCRQLKN